MDSFAAFVTMFFVVFLIFPSLFMCLKLLALCCSKNNQRRASVSNLGPTARQAPIYTIASDPRNNDPTSNFPDFFYNRSNEPIKDDKDLPSYEEVMRMEMARQDSAATQPPLTTAANTVVTVPPV